MLAWWYLLIPDSILSFGATGTGVFLLRTATGIRELDGCLCDPATEIFLGVAETIIGIRKFDGCLLDPATEIFLGDAETVGAGFFRSMIEFNDHGACVLVEARTLPAGELVKSPDASTKAPRNKD